MASPDKGKLSQGRAASHHPRYINIMIMRSVGKIRSFRISVRVILIILCFLIIYLPVSVLIINAYLHLKFDHQRWTIDYQTLKEELNNTQKDLAVSNQRLAFLRSFIEDIERSENNQVAITTPESGEMHERARIDDSIIDVKDMVVHRIESDKIRVNFRLVNTRPGEDAADGYVHIMTFNDRLNIPANWIHPRAEIRDGFPVNYKRGLPFYIERFKPYRHDFLLTPDQSPPAIVRVLVYNQNGSIMLDKEFDIKSDS